MSVVNNGDGHGYSYMKCQHFGKSRQVTHLSTRVQDQCGQHGETVSTKNTNIGRAWWHMPIVAATQEAEAAAAVSQDPVTALQPVKKVTKIWLPSEH